VVLGAIFASALNSNNLPRVSRPRDSPRSTRAEKERWNRVFDAITGAKLEARNDENRPAEMKRNLLQTNNSNVQIYPWAYAIYTFGFSHKNRIYAVNSDNQVLVSYNELLTFTLIPEIPAADRIYAIDVSPVNEDVIIFMGEMGNWITRNGGLTFTKQTPNFYRNIVFHPTQPEWLIATKPVLTAVGPQRLFVSKDLGNSFSEIATNVYQFDWCRAGIDGMSLERICVISGDTVPHARFSYTDDLGRTWHVPMAQRAYFFYIHDRFFTLAADYNGSIDFYVSADDGDTFRRAILPSGVTVGVLEPQQFIEDNNGVIWIVVHPLGGGDYGKSTSGHLYVSDADGYRFAKALENVHTLNNWWDVEIIPSIEGTLIANQLILAEPLLLQSKITYDNGDTWSFLEPPPRDANNVPYNCATLRSNPCKLHLNGITTWLGVGGDGYFGNLYSVHEAVGMILATGTVGTTWNASGSAQNTYFSRDGGLSWDEIMKGATIYEYGDFGGLLVMAGNQAPTDQVYYSLDGGESFGFVTLPQPVQVVNIVTASTRGERVILIGFDPKITGLRRFYGIDFSQIHERNCTGADYELWEPHDGVNGPKCVLGHDVLYQRRKRDSACFTMMV